MKIDLHCHTKATKKNETRNRNVTTALFKEKIEQAEVGIVGITNHNCLDVEQFNRFVDAVRDSDVMLWPGVELDVIGRNDNRYHMLVIGSPKNIDLISEKLSALLCDKTPSDFSCTFDDVWNEFQNDEVIFIPHCHDKRPYIREDEIDYIHKVTGEDWRFFYEPSSLTTVGIWTNHGWNMLLGSDVQNWAEYEKSRFSTLRLPVSSFEQFCLLAQKNVPVIQTLLSQRDPKEMTVYPHKDVAIEIPIYEDINILFGQKGTGKTEIIKSLKRHYENKGVPYKYYYASEKTATFDKLLDTSDIPRDPSMFGRSTCLDELDYLYGWQDEAPTPLQNYEKWWKTKDNNSRRAKLAIADIRHLPIVSENDYLTAKDDLEIIEKFIASVNDRNLLRYLDHSEASAFIETLRELFINAHAQMVKGYLSATSVRLTNKSLDEIKSIADKKSDTVSKPGTTGLTSFVVKRVSLAKATKTVLENLQPLQKSNRLYLGTLEDKGQLYIETRYRYLTNGSLTDEFDKGITKLKECKKLFDLVPASLLSNNPGEAIADFHKAMEDAEIKGISSFIGITKRVIFGDSNNPYNPSDGEKGILLLEKMINEPADVYLLDEPESGMSNIYIDTVIRTALQDLAKSRKTVIVATHNANIAVRTLPYS